MLVEANAAAKSTDATTPGMMEVFDRTTSTRFSEFARSNSITVLIPARNEEATVGQIVSKLTRRYAHGSEQLVKIVVVNDHSTDGTLSAAADSGALVITRDDPDHPAGKAEAIVEGIRAFPSDVYVLFDADVSDFDARWLELLCLGLEKSDAILAKGTYSRPVKSLSLSHERFAEGGRVTELVARPLLSICFPDLASFGQPLSGEVAFRSALVESSPLCIGYGLDVGLLIDSYLRFGLDSIVEVELGKRSHNHQALSALSYQASQVALTILMKAGMDVKSLPGAGRLIRPGKPEKIVPFGILDIGGSNRFESPSHGDAD